MADEEQPTQVMAPERERRGWSFGKPRQPEEVDADPGRLLAIGQLTVAGAFVADWLLSREDEESQAMGRRLARVVDWYFEKPEQAERRR
jgi:hypothetical protein